VRAILEKILQADDLSFGVRDFKCRRFDCPFHHHPEIELTHIVRSGGQRYVGDHIGRFAAGDLVLMGSGLPHMYVNDANAKGGAQSRVLQFLPDCLGPGFFQLGETKKIRSLIERARVGLSFHGRTRDQVAELLRQLSARGNGIERLLLLMRILDALARTKDVRTLASRSYSPTLSLHQGERINRVCKLISLKFREGIAQGEAARTAGMSSPSFSRFFRRATNKTFRAFVNEVRIGHASQMLMETECSVSEACYASGFANLSNFNRQFLRLRRISPRAYREKALHGAAVATQKPSASSDR
jgi:AraC-like DNA-binding protein